MGNFERRMFSFSAQLIETVDGSEWFIEFPDVPGVVGGGSDIHEAIEEAYENLEAHFEFLEMEGIAPPKPTVYPDQEYSGKLLVRMSKSTHKRLLKLAEKENVSANTIVNEAIITRITQSEDERMLQIGLSAAKAFINNLGFETTIKKIDRTVSIPYGKNYSERYFKHVN